MSRDARQMLKRLLPRSAKQIIWDLRKRVAGPPIDDAVLAKYRFAADETVEARLNFVIPNIAPAELFGGVATGQDIVLKTLLALREKMPLSFRLILTDPTHDSDPEIFRKNAAAAGIPGESIEMLPVEAKNQPIAVRKRDFFITYNWWTTLNVATLLRQQAAHFGMPQKPLVYLIQEYEPHMMAFSSAHILAREAYDTFPRLWGVFNSSNLHNYFTRQGHRTEKHFVFEPVINAKLRPALSEVSSSAREKRILVYGRPAIDRNCFPALLRGLQQWASDYPEYSDWEVVSAGTAHKPMPLGDGRMLRSVGKLSMEGYRDMLLGSSVGVCLMASPHPSYPPFEMAHMGLNTITNTYLDKSWDAIHPRIHGVSSIRASEISQALADACAKHEEPRDADPLESYVREEDYPFLGELVDAIAAELA